MKNLKIGGMNIPAIALGCMRMSALGTSDASALIRTSLDHGINFFDHADIYGQGQALRSEDVFAAAVKELKVPR